ncbi:hypothetical protein ASE01_16415 [Nocardioides sp. Root190]|uniref:HNH endonuclease signature motif containing protein n=1 Tax=Nocardioides sp. Root190 TaxID=1736488 RepID=UPI0006FC1810|nr:HNH endonuclease signature motif containing protein [Nocardioides sp. Root190]KRB74959.1 hypothetical protein ASE01_16415 [Nocardioides sp. Root190]
MGTDLGTASTALIGRNASVIAGRVMPYKAHRIADQTKSLTPDAAAFVDRQLDRLIAEAIIRFDPDRAEAELQKAREHRFCEVSEVDEHGNALITAVKCDIDHEIPHHTGGPTCPCNLDPLCRRHHRAKTFSQWR